MRCTLPRSLRPRILAALPPAATATALLGAAALILAGCGRSEKSATAAETQAAPVVATPPAPRPGDESLPIPLEQAIAKGLCTVRSISTMAFNSRYVDFSIAAKVESRPWIRIEPGWLLRAKTGPGSWVTVLPVTVQLARTGASTYVPAAEITRANSVPVDLDWSRLPTSDPLGVLLRAAAAASTEPSWNVMQTAVFAVARDLDLAAARAEKFSADRNTGTVVIVGGAGGRVAHHAGVIDQAAALVRAAGLDPARYRLFVELEAAFTQALADWQARRSDLQALDLLGFFRTRPQAFAILSTVPTSRPVDKAFYREMAYRHLGEGLVDYTRRPFSVDAKYRAALEAALTRESDMKLRREITGHLERAAKAATQ